MMSHAAPEVETTQQPAEVTSGSGVIDLGEEEIEHREWKSETLSDPGDPVSCSSSTSDDNCIVEPKKVPEPFALPRGTIMWKHKKFKTCHLMFEHHTQVFLCNRTLSQMYERASPNQRFDVRKCRQCFKSKALAED